MTHPTKAGQLVTAGGEYKLGVTVSTNSEHGPKASQIVVMWVGDSWPVAMEKFQLTVVEPETVPVPVSATQQFTVRARSNGEVTAHIVYATDANNAVATVARVYQTAGKTCTIASVSAN